MYVYRLQINWENQQKKSGLSRQDGRHDQLPIHLQCLQFFNTKQTNLPNLRNYKHKLSIPQSSFNFTRIIEEFGAFH
jgi:hypothetical protein